MFLTNPKLKEIWARKKAVAPMFKSRCYICHKKMTTGKGFVYHHIYYWDNGVVHSDENYHDKIYNEIAKYPERFLLLCNAHHQALERLKRFKVANFNRLVKAVRLSR